MRRDYRIPFNRPFLAGRELEYVEDAVRSGHLAGNGSYTRRCEAFLEQRYGVARALLTPSATSALELAGLILDWKPGDEVLLPSFTFVSTANAVALRGATPVFCDVGPGDANLDPTLLEMALTDCTRAILPVHYGGVACAMDRIGEIAERHDLVVVEDAAHGLEARYGERALGTIGALGVLSFHETKNVISGEGGALLVNDPALVERAEIMREKGTNRPAFFRGMVDHYTWVERGGSHLPSEVVAAFLFAQLECLEAIQARRRTLHARYRELLAPLASRGALEFLAASRVGSHNAHMFPILLADEPTRRRLIDHLAARDILAVHHYVPLHASPAGRRFGRVGTPMDVTNDLAARLLRLPLYHTLTEAEQDEVIAAVGSFW
ncbi:MAG: dTDP-4-amino-4,6-dideoxygalactose transaminase [Planctomycetes bacterium]|nr:dTDP-4-amino-4,6-dideoxygalactose transaminase [Planctomycetota bacterium]